MSPQLNSIVQNWNKYWPSDMLFDNRLINKLPDRWVRFHTLPNSKRYPDTEKETAIIIDRHNTLLSELKTSDNIVLITTQYSNKDSDDRLIRNPIDPEAELCRVIFDSPDETDSDFFTYIYFYVSIKKWHAGVVDNILKEVIDDRINGVMIAPYDMQWLYHPYDGGMDIYCSSTAQRDTLKKRYEDWLSKSETGL